MATPTTDLLLGPLTTPFIAPPSCNSITVAFESPSYSPYVYPRRFSSIASSCFPSNYPLGNAAFTSIFIAYGQQDQHVYYSPGICPSGWSENIAGTSGAETTAFCCQPGFHAQTSPAVNPPGGVSTLCTSRIEETVISTVAYTGDGEVEGNTATFTFEGNNVPAGAIWIRYKSEDFTDASTISGSTPTPTTNSSLSVSSNSSPRSTSANSSETGSFDKQQPPLSTGPGSNSTSTPTPESTPSHGLSTAAKIGLGVGIPLAALSALLIAVLLFFRNRGKRLAAATAMGVQGEGMDSESKGPAELSCSSVKRRSELPCSGVGNGTMGRAELNGCEDGGGRTGSGVHELPASSLTDS
ncbi:hypothetical protein BKA64DRAFT_145924 [Cadophora sp. MPI-SDFR-AT-0126]|nr:hypothetical protein BKA64DRAFT_145924 [Leotiomycetes sp. MPI-SDFR-AT-0126]